METNDWILAQAVQEAQDDAEWEQQEAQQQRQRQEQQAAALAQEKKAISKTQLGDQYASSGDGDVGVDANKIGNDLDCLACFSFLVRAVRALT